MINAIIALFFLFGIFVGVVVVVARLRKVGRWNRTYQKLSLRYGGSKKKSIKKGANTFVEVFGLKKPSLRFSYGRTFCYLRNRKSTKFSDNSVGPSNGHSTELTMNWPDRKLRLEVSTSSQQNQHWGRTDLFRQIVIDEPQFQSNFYVTSNDSVSAKRILNNGVQWQIEQLRRHMGTQKVLITISGGKLSVSKPGYIKGYQDLEDFVRFSLNLFDQMMLVDAKGIEFVNENEASVVSDVKCPICSEEIRLDMVVCTRCKTPHCLDCWQYNGQCATFACNEKRYISTGQVRAHDS